MSYPERVSGVLPRMAFLLMAPVAVVVLVLAAASSVSAGTAGGKASDAPVPYVSNVVSAAIPTDVISGGGGTSTSASYKISDTFGQGPIGPPAVGTTVNLQDGFWATISAKGAPADTLPPGPVTTFETFPQDTSAGLSWTTPSDADFAGVLIVFSTVSYPDTVTDGAPVPNGHGGEFPNLPGVGDDWVHQGLTNGDTYYYSAFAFDAARNYAPGVHAVATPLDIVPPPAVTVFHATPEDTTVLLGWQDPDDPDFDHALVRFATDHAPSTVTEGSPVPNGNNGTFPNVPGSADSFVHTGLTNGVTYYYSIWSCDEVPNCSARQDWDVSATPEDTVPPGQPDYFTAAAAGDRGIILRWKNPPDADLEQVQIRYSTSSYPNTPAEGLAVENGNGGAFPAVPAAVDSFVHSNLLAGVVHYYSAFPLDEAANYTSPPKGDLATPVDNNPPGITLSVFQNPYVTNHLDIYLIASEPVQDASVSVEIDGDPITMVENDAAEYVYRGDYELCCDGTISMEGCATDIAGNDTCETRDFGVSLIRFASGGTASSVDGKFAIAFPGRALASDAYVLISESLVLGTMVYEVSPRAMPLGEFVEIAVAYDAAAEDAEHIAVARVDGDVVTPLDSYLDREHGRILAYADQLGSYRLLRKEDAVTPDYGSGKFRIVSNVPNPFVESTSIEFDVARAGKIEVEIVSVEGRHVRTLGGNFVPPGRRSLVWDGCDDYGRRVAGGMYACRAISGQDKVTHKMVYLR